MITFDLFCMWIEVKASMEDHEQKFEGKISHQRFPLYDWYGTKWIFNQERPVCNIIFIVIYERPLNFFFAYTPSKKCPKQILWLAQYFSNFFACKFFWFSLIFIQHNIRMRFFVCSSKWGFCTKHSHTTKQTKRNLCVIVLWECLTSHNSLSLSHQWSYSLKATMRES